MENKFKQFLESNKLLPLDNGCWKKITVNHTPDVNSSEVMKHIEKDLEGFTSGVYVYTNLEGEVYYVGQGKLKRRIKKKYQQSTYNYYKPGIDPKKVPSARYYFFRSKREIMNVYVLNVEGTIEQIAVEAMLSSVLKPKYFEYLLEYNKLKKNGLLVERLKDIQQIPAVL